MAERTTDRRRSRVALAALAVLLAALFALAPRAAVAGPDDDPKKDAKKDSKKDPEKDAKEDSRKDAKPHETLRGFTRSGQYTLFVDRKVQSKARIFHSRRAGAFLILDSDFGKPWLVLPREKRIATVPADAVLDPKAKSIDLSESAEPKELGKLEIQGRDLLIHVEGLVARMHPRAHALGALSKDELLLHTPDYESGAKRYRPNRRDLQRLIDCATETEVTIFFGTWCPTCKRLLPRVLHVDGKIKGSKIKITYYGLPKGRGMRSEPEARRQRVTRVPTGVIFVNGRRVGTISSRGLNRPETALCAALTSSRRR